ncbi:hypothetical protein VKS41_000352 [Umbelopsis sp. WA50703]
MALYSSPYRTSRPRLESPQRAPFPYNRSSHYHRYTSPSPPQLPSNNRGNALPFSSSTNTTPNSAPSIKSTNGSSNSMIQQQTQPAAVIASIAEAKDKQQAAMAVQPAPQPTAATATTNSDSQQDSAQSQEITWLFFRDNKWMPFQSENHYKIEQAFTLGGIYVDIKDHNFPQLKSIRVFPTRFYLSYLGMKYRLSCVIQG